MIYRELSGYKYELMERIAFTVFGFAGMTIGNGYVKISNSTLAIEAHYAWDGPSGPTIDTKTFMRGSLVHDALYQLMREGYLDRKRFRKQADILLRKICLLNGMNKFRAWYVYHSVRMFGGNSAKPRKNPRGDIREI